MVTTEEVFGLDCGIGFALQEVIITLHSVPYRQTKTPQTEEEDRDQQVLSKAGTVAVTFFYLNEWSLTQCLGLHLCSGVMGGKAQPMKAPSPFFLP